MKVRVSWRNAAKHAYIDPQGCPLFHALEDLGFKAIYVSSGFVRVGDSGKAYSFEDGYNSKKQVPTHWNCYTARWCARRHRSFDVEIPGLEAELTQAQLYKLGYVEVHAK